MKRNVDDIDDMFDDRYAWKQEENTVTFALAEQPTPYFPTGNSCFVVPTAHLPYYVSAVLFRTKPLYGIARGHWNILNVHTSQTGLLENLTKGDYAFWKDCEKSSAEKTACGFGSDSDSEDRWEPLDEKQGEEIIEHLYDWCIEMRRKFETAAPVATREVARICMTRLRAE